MSQSMRIADLRSTLYRGLGWLVVLALVGASIIIFLVTVGLLQPEHLAPGWEPADQLLRFAVDAQGLAMVPIAAVTLVVAILGLALLSAPLSRSQRSSSLHLLSSDERGFVVVDSQGIARIAELAAVSASGVIDAEVGIRGSGMSPVRVRVDVGVVPGANIKQTGVDVQEAVRDAVENLVGIDVRDVNTTVHVMEPEGFGRLLQ
jgi:uncharacterized alkaline shock family protein YloU